MQSNLPALTALVTATSFGTSSCPVYRSGRRTTFPSRAYSRAKPIATKALRQHLARTSHTTRDRAAWGTTTFRVLTLFRNQLAAVFIDECGNNAHQQNLNRVEFHTHLFPHEALTLFSTQADYFWLLASGFLLLDRFSLFGRCSLLFAFRFVAWLRAP